MKGHLIFFGVVLCSSVLAVIGAYGQASAFTYQGNLRDGLTLANGSYDLRFSLYNAVANGSVIGNAITNSATATTNGLFSVTLDFGAEAFNGDGRWLEIGVRTNGSEDDFMILSPRQSVTASPYAIQAVKAAGLTGPLATTNLSGTIPDASLSANVVLLNSNQNFTGANMFTSPSNSFVGNGSGLVQLSAASLVGAILDSQLSSNVALLDAEQTHTATKKFANGLIAQGLTNSGQYFQTNFANGAFLIIGTNANIIYRDQSGCITQTGPDGYFSIQQTNGSFFTVSNGNITCSGSLSISNVSGIIADGQLTPNVALLSGNQTFAGANTFGAAGNSFSGNGAGLTDINTSNLSGTINDAQLSANVARLNNSQIFTGANGFSSSGNSFTGNGAGLMSLNGAHITGGTINSNAFDAATAAQLALAGDSGAPNFNATQFAISNNTESIATGATFTNVVFMNTNSPSVTAHGTVKVSGVSTNKAYLLGNGDWYITAVPWIRPSDTNSGIAFDIMPNANPGVSRTTWIDILSTDFTADTANYESMRLIKYANGDGDISMNATGTGGIRNLTLQTGPGNTGRVGIGCIPVKVFQVGTTAINNFGVSDNGGHVLLDSWNVNTGRIPLDLQAQGFHFWNTNLTVERQTFSENGDYTNQTGNVVIRTAGKGLQIKGGTNAKVGESTLVDGIVTVLNTSVTANSIILMNEHTVAGLPGTLSYTVTPGVSFTVNSTSLVDESTVVWMIVENN